MQCTHQQQYKKLEQTYSSTTQLNHIEGTDLQHIADSDMNQLLTATGIQC